MGSFPRLSIIKGQQNDFISESLHRLFESNLDNCSTNIALLCQDIKFKTKLTQLTYEELNENANKIAKNIVRETAQNFLKPNNDGDSIIAVCMQPSDKLITVLLAIWKSGAAYLPLDPTFPVNRIHHILNESKPLMVIADDSIDLTTFQKTYSIKISDLIVKSQSMDGTNLSNSKMIPFKNHNLGIVLYTSGSTGIPKGVRIQHSIILNRLKWQWEKFPYSSTERVGVFKTALTFVDSVSEIWGPLLNGMAILVIPKEVTKDPEHLIKLLEEFKIERLILVPTLLRSILMFLDMNKQENLLNNLKIWVCSGEPLSITLAKSFYDYFTEGQQKLFNFYGSTEVMGDVTYFICENKKDLDNFDRVPIGIPIYNTIIYLLDQDYRPVKNGEIGEIFVAGSNLSDGYVNNRDKERFIENPLAAEKKYSKLYRTGDYGSVVDGFIMYEGRTDSQIKVRGHRVDLSEIEKNLTNMSDIDKAIILCYHAGEIDQALLAFVKFKEYSKNLTGLQIESKLQDKLPAYMIPQVVVIDEIPLLVNGKVDRQSLLKSYENTNNNNDTEIEIDYDYTSVPENLKGIAKDVFEIIGSVIGRSTRTTLSIKSNFYELGGNSLNSIFTVTQLREKGYFIGISDFINSKNLGEVLFKISKNDIIDTAQQFDVCSNLDLKAYPITQNDKDIVTNILTDSFYEKADLEHWLKPEVTREDYIEIIDALWEHLLEHQLSFLVKNSITSEIVAVTLSFDLNNEPEIHVDNKMVVVFEFLEALEGPIRENCLPKGPNKVVHNFMMGTAENLNPQENIACISFMETEVLNLAKSKEYCGIFTTNTSPLTQQFGNDVFGYKVLLDYQVNQWIHPDGSKPFGQAPDSQRAICHYKKIE